METLTDGARRSRKCGEGFIRGTKIPAYRRFSTGRSSFAPTLLTEQGKTPISAVHHRNVNKLLETLASRPCLFSWVEPWENTTLDSGLLCLFYVLSVRLLLHFSVYGWEDFCAYIWPLHHERKEGQAGPAAWWARVPPGPSVRRGLVSCFKERQDKI